MFTTISQRFDLALGVALLRKKGREGVIVQGRTREGADFDWLQFKLDPHSWYAQEKNPPLKRNVEVEYLNPDDID